MPVRDVAVSAGALLLGAMVAASDAAFFRSEPGAGYLVHHLLATAAGVAMVVASWRLLERVADLRSVLLLDLLFGVGMIVIHVSKLAWIRC